MREVIKLKERPEGFAIITNDYIFIGTGKKNDHGTTNCPRSHNTKS